MLIRLVRILGELYNYSVVSAPVIYELLYTVINYGHLKETRGDEVKKALSVGEAPHRCDIYLTDTTPMQCYVT